MAEIEVRRLICGMLLALGFAMVFVNAWASLGMMFTACVGNALWLWLRTPAFAEAPEDEWTRRRSVANDLQGAAFLFGFFVVVLGFDRTAIAGGRPAGSFPAGLAVAAAIFSLSALAWMRLRMLERQRGVGTASDRVDTMGNLVFALGGAATLIGLGVMLLLR